MPQVRITLETPVVETPRVLQVCGIFDLPRQATSRVQWDVALPLEARPWHVGLIVGPSGCGKSTIARHLFGDALAAQSPLDEWPEDRALLDAFPEAMPVKDVVALLSSVGFASPPAWLRPFRVLSTGQQFRARLARLLACCPALAVMDEYTSVVDRTVAQVGSAALAKTVRQRGQKFVAVTCHEDVEEWLQPDWTFRPAENAFQWRCLQRRPAVVLRVFRCRHAAWRLFHHHHYLSGELSRGSVCFLAEWRGRPVAFSAWVNALTRRGGKREHRTVVLPDYQGIGVGHALSGFCASLWKGLGERATSTTTHPAFVAARLRSPDWRLVRRPSLAAGGDKRRALRHATTRLTAGFEYVGPALDPAVARRCWSGADMDRVRLTPEVERQIASYIRAGGYAHVSAEAAGVPQAVFLRWMARGRRKKAKEPYRRFWLHVLQAQAQARLGAEMEVRKKDAKFWLRYGPGKDAGTGAAWGARLKVTAEPGGLANADVRELLGLVVRGLAAFPEAKQAVLQMLEMRGKVCSHDESSAPPSAPAPAVEGDP